MPFDKKEYNRLYYLRYKQEIHEYKSRWYRSYIDLILPHYNQTAKIWNKQNSDRYKHNQKIWNLVRPNYKKDYCKMWRLEQKIKKLNNTESIIG